MNHAKIVRLDLAGLKCPLPVLKARRALTHLDAGQRVEVHCTDPMAAIDIPHMVQQTGDRLVKIDHIGTSLIFLIEKAPR